MVQVPLQRGEPAPPVNEGGRPCGVDRPGKGTGRAETLPAQSAIEDEAMLTQHVQSLDVKPHWARLLRLFFRAVKPVAPKTGAGRECTSHGHGREAGEVGTRKTGRGPDRAAGQRWPGARPARRRGRQAAGVGVARRRARPAAAAGRGRPDRRPQVSTRKKATGPDRAAGRRRPGARPARGRGRQAAGVGVARRRARPAAAAGRRWLGARPARGRGQQSKGSGPPGAGHVQQGQRASAGQVLADVASSRRGRGCPAPSTSSRGSGPASAGCSPSSRA